MEEKKIKNYFKQQVRVILERSASEPDGFLAYFSDREPTDEEIMGLLAVSSMMSGEFHLGDSFPSSVEALASLSTSSRAAICREFRKQLKSSLRQLTAA